MQCGIHCIVCVHVSIPASLAEGKHLHWNGFADSLAGRFSLLKLLQTLYI